jgi:hypothetical protein
VLAPMPKKRIGYPPPPSCCNVCNNITGYRYSAQSWRPCGQRLAAPRSAATSACTTTVYSTQPVPVVHQQQTPQ